MDAVVDVSYCGKEEEVMRVPKAKDIMSVPDMFLTKEERKEKQRRLQERRRQRSHLRPASRRPCFRRLPFGESS